MNFGIIGGDNRQLFIKKFLENKGYETRTFGCVGEEADNAAFDCDAVIFPMPLSRDGVTLNAPSLEEKIPLLDIVSRLRPEQTVFGGFFPEWLRRELLNRKIRFFDYGESEYLTRLNAVLTAEGAVAVAVFSTPRSIFESKSLVVGFGRIGRTLAKYLSALGARVTVSARKESDFADIRACGFSAIKTADIANFAEEFDLIFNTVPVEVFKDSALQKINPDCALIELASAPGGVDKKAAKKRNTKIINAPSLPGKYSPEKAAKIIFEFISDRI